MTDRMNPTDQATQLTQEARDEAVYRALLVVMGDTPRAAAPHEFIRLLEQDGYTVAARRAIEGSGVVSVERLLDAWEALENPSIDAAIAAALPRPEEPRVEDFGVPQQEEDALKQESARFCDVSVLRPDGERQYCVYREPCPDHAARRAIEGSGVVSVEEMAKALHAIGMGCWSPRGPGGALCKEVTEGNPLNDLHTPTAARLLAALPRPDEPRVDRCAAGVHAVHAGIPTVVTCGEARDSETHEQGAPDFDHPFTPEAR